MQYSVPQFIDVEDKIVGPFTGKQTIFLMIGGGFLMLIFSLFDTLFFIIMLIFTVPLTLAFAFWKPKGMTVARWIMNITNYYTSEHFYVWRKEPEGMKFKPTQKKKTKIIPLKNVSRDRIGELAWLLDTSSSISLPYEIRERPGKKMARK